jgi:5-hydroxyisourate hydrolase-like protein (transthyretin family)
VVESFGGVTKVADGHDILKNHEALKQRGVGLDSLSFEDPTNMTLVDVKATEKGVYESLITYQGKTYAGSSLPNNINTQATIRSGEYRYEVVYSDYYKSNVLVINEGGRVPVIGLNPNVNYLATYGTHYADEILVHYGSSSIWRGSAGCITIHPDQWKEFISNFNKGDTGIIRINR